MSNNDNSRGSSGTNRRRFLAGAGAASVAGLAGCLDSITGGSGGEGPIRLGGVYLLSGVAEALGAASAAAAEVAVDVINENGGILDREVEIQFRDHGQNPQQQIRSLVQEENVDAMLGLTSSGVTLASGPTIEQLGVPFTLTDIGTPFPTEHDVDTYGDYYEDENGTAAGIPNLFRTNANTSTTTYGIAKWAADNLDATRVANIGPDYAYGTQTWDYFKAYSDGLGADYEYVESVFPSLGASDMTPQINQVLNADPDIVFTSFWAGDVTTFVGQAVEQGLFEQVDDVFDTIGADPTVFSALGDTMPEGFHYSGWYWHSAYDNENNQRFLDAYADAYEDDSETISIPSFTGGSTWAAVFIYKQAMEAAGSTNPDDVISEMEGLTFAEDPRGSITLDADSHQATAPMVIGETSRDDDVPYDGVGLTNTETYTLDRSTATDLLEGSDLPPGV
ncbi:ABC transporter substrate-binding protein [Salinirubellus salinus]|uniref:ABC transporter substrate-binding protein n=1 Tax=Salinirubellus salinus TaxID=1364945 RepID=A0A9E7R252_9EURY|nr:ABC transporter substrate-binding protein [Salinirubellus salinus]UWM53245.1 ABC transporter substrate-binding protein [Salinirubellus salinus]